MTDYNALLQRYNSKLTEQRMLLKQWADVVIKQYDALPATIRSSLPPLPGRTAQEMVPALFHDPITAEDEVAYAQQIKALQDFVTACNLQVDNINASEVVRCKLQ